MEIVVVSVRHSLLASSACSGGIAGSMEGLELGTLVPVIVYRIGAAASGTTLVGVLGHAQLLRRRNCRPF